MPDSAWKALPVRQQIIDWLDAQGIGWKRCGHFAADGLPWATLYRPALYNKSLPAFQDLEAFLENPNGTMRYPEVFFVYCSLDKAMENAAHDEPGFWDRWAENF